MEPHSLFRTWSAWSRFFGSCVCSGSSSWRATPPASSHSASPSRTATRQEVAPFALLRRFRELYSAFGWWGWEPLPLQLSPLPTTFPSVGRVTTSVIFPLHQISFCFSLLAFPLFYFIFWKRIGGVQKLGPLWLLIGFILWGKWMYKIRIINERNHMQTGM